MFLACFVFVFVFVFEYLITTRNNWLQFDQQVLLASNIVEINLLKWRNTLHLSFVTQWNQIMIQLAYIVIDSAIKTISQGKEKNTTDFEYYMYVHISLSACNTCVAFNKRCSECCCCLPLLFQFTFGWRPLKKKEPRGWSVNWIPWNGDCLWTN